MARTISARRHAQAVFEIALEKNELGKWKSDLENIAGTLKDPELSTLLENPKIPFSQKAGLLRGVLTEISPLAMNLVGFLVTKNRLKILGDLVAEYKHMLDTYYGREQAEVITAVSLSEDEKERLRKKLSEISNKDIILAAQVDPDIEGGLVAKIGDKLIDGSVRTKLQELRRGLSEAGLEVR
jgi:F-type H+-transporting ATPase subunit delta